MTTIVIFEDEGYRSLLPLTYWRSSGELRTGYYTLLQYAARALPKADLHVYCRPSIAAVTAQRIKFPVNTRPAVESAIFINSRLLLTSAPEPGPAPAVQWEEHTPLIIHADRSLLELLTPQVMQDGLLLRQVLTRVPVHTFLPAPRLIRYPWDLVHANRELLEYCWKQAAHAAELAGRVCPGAHLLNKLAIHLGRGTVIKPGAVLDAENGPVYIGENVTVSANTSIEGPCFIGDGSLVQPGSALRDAVSIGRRCKVGGELESSILHGHSNKQHDGFLGHSYVGEWVNLAADTVNSDLKNTYGTVRVPINGVEVESGQIFVGLTIGDHSKTGIGQMFHTGAVVGFGSNVATCEFAPRFVPSFTWLTGEGASPYDPQRCLEVAQRVMARREVTMTDAERALFLSIPAQARQIEKPLGGTS